MTQGALNVPTGSGLAVRTGFNDALERLATRAAGTARPSDIKTYEHWIETDNPGGGIASVWQWDGTADVLIGLLNTTTHAFVAPSVLTTQGDILYRGASADARLAAAADAYKALFSGGAGANPAFAGTWKVLGEVVAGSGVGSIDVTGIPAGIDHLMVLFRVRPGTNNVMVSLLTAGADGNFDAGGSDYAYSQIVLPNSGGAVAQGSAAAGAIPLGYGANPVSNNADEGGCAGFLTFADIQHVSFTRCQIQSSHQNQNLANRACIIGDGIRLEQDRITGLRFLASAGNVLGRVLVLGASN